MLGLGVVVLWSGYSLLFWGVAFLGGTELGFLTVVWPTHWQAPKSTAKAKKG